MAEDFQRHVDSVGRIQFAQALGHYILGFHAFQAAFVDESILYGMAHTVCEPIKIRFGNNPHDFSKTHHGEVVERVFRKNLFYGQQAVLGTNRYQIGGHNGGNSFKRDHILIFLTKKVRFDER
jgi:hypothetical protein